MKKLVSLRNKKGFTLVELIIVIAIIAVLAAVVAPQYIKYVDKSKVSTDINNLAAVENAINVLCADPNITISTGSTLVYNTSGTLTSTGTCKNGSTDSSLAAEVCKLIGGTSTTDSYTTKKLTSTKASNVTFTVTISDSTPVVTNLDSATTPASYTTWAN